MRHFAIVYRTYYYTEWFINVTNNRRIQKLETAFYLMRTVCVTCNIFITVSIQYLFIYLYFFGESVTVKCIHQICEATTFGKIVWILIWNTFSHNLSINSPAKYANRNGKARALHIYYVHKSKFMSLFVHCFTLCAFLIGFCVQKLIEHLKMTTKKPPNESIEIV